MASKEEKELAKRGTIDFDPVSACHGRFAVWGSYRANKGMTTVPSLLVDLMNYCISDGLDFNEQLLLAQEEFAKRKQNESSS